MASEPKFNHSILSDLREQLGLTLGDLSRHTKISVERIRSIESGDAEPNSEELQQFGRTFNLHEYQFFRSTPVKKNKTVNFRILKNQYSIDTPVVLDAIEQAHKIHKLLVTVADPVSIWENSKRKIVKGLNSHDPELSGLIWRDFIGLSDDQQISFSDAGKFFAFFRGKVELTGISVVSFSYEDKHFKGLALGATSSVPLILINSFRQSKASRSFTLAHELGHIVQGEDGVSNPYDVDNKLERYCNKFAAGLLLPKRLIDSVINTRKGVITFDNTTLKWLSNKLKVSQEAIVIRLQEIGYVANNFWRDWKKQFDKAGYLPSEEKTGGGGGETEQGVVKLAYFGLLFGRTVPKRYKERGLSEVAIYKASHLKPKFIKALSEAADNRATEVSSYGETSG